MVGRAPGMGSPAAFGPGFVHEVGVLTWIKPLKAPSSCVTIATGAF